jgi:NADH:ubiquinone oxidoreductase subunit 2 (subunit N)
MEFWFFPFVSGVGLIALLVSNDFLFLYIAVELYSIAIYVWFGYIAANPMYLLRENDWRKRYTLPMSVGVGTPHPRKADAVGDGRLGSVAQLSTGSERNRLDTQPNVIQRNCIRCMCNCQPMSSSLLSRTLTFPSLENVQVAEQKSTLVRNSRNEESILCAVQGALRYVLVGIFGSLLLIYGICNFYVTFGTLNFDELALLNLIGDSSSSVSQSTFACTFFLLGLFIKMGLAPFHIWIISVYDRLPWSLFMYVSMLPKIAYFFVLWQILTLFSLLENYLFFLFSFIAIINVITGTFYAIFQKSLKRFFLGSSLVSSGYLLITLALPTSWNFFTFVVYLTIYVITMFTFYCIIMRYNQVLFSAPVLNLRQKIDLHSNGSAEPHPCLVFASRPLECSHSVSSINTSSDRFVRVYDWHRKLSSVQSQLSAPTPTSSFGEVDIQFSPTLASGSIDSNVYFGQLYKLPTFAKVMLTVLLFSLIGIPPLAGFYGKLFVFIYLIHNNFYVITLLLFFQSVLAGYYYLRLIRILFFHRIDSSSATLIKKNMANVIADQITTPIHCEPTIMSKSTSLSPSTQWLRMYPSRGLQSTDHTYGNVDLNSTHLSLHTNQKLDQVTPTHLYPNKRRMVVCSVSFRKNQYSSNSYRQPKSKSTPLIELFLYVNVAILFLFGLCL